MTLALFLAALAQFQPVQPNILLVLMDDVGRWDIAPAIDSALTPNIDSLAASGTRFENCWAMPICTPTRSTLLTGTYPFRHGMGNSVGINGTVGLSLAGHLPSRLPGYATGFFGKWHVSAVNASDPLDSPAVMGFDFWAGHWFNLLGADTYFAWPKTKNGVNLGTSTVYATKDQKQEARRWMIQQPEPWFMLWSWTAAHSPYHNPPGYSPGPVQREKFKAMIEYADTQLGLLLADLPANTVVIVVGDNGTPSPVRPPELSNSPKAKGWPYEGGLRVPLIVSGPGIPAQTINDLVGTVDLWATVLALAGVAGVTADSESLLPLIQTGAALSKQYQYAERFNPNGAAPTTADWRRAISDGSWKLIELDGVRELYNLDVDPFERFDEYGNPMYAGIQATLEAALDAVAI